MAEHVLPGGFILRDRYKILRRLGGKELSNLYITGDMLKNEYRVVKELINAFGSEEQRKEAIQQFKFEARLLVTLNHPQLPRIEDYFEYDEKYYLVMEYLEADELDALIKESPEQPDELQVLKWGLDLCRVLSYLHSQSPDPVIFRALSPDNVMLTDKGKVMLVNFGISKIFNPRAQTIAIAKSINPHFSPIEQYSTHSTDERSDIYSLGATLYYCITKNLPVDAIDRSIGKVDLIPPKNFNSSMSREFSNVIMKSMSVKKADRYQSVKEIEKELNEIYENLKSRKTADLPEKEISSEMKKDGEKKKNIIYKAIALVSLSLLITSCLFSFIVSAGSFYYVYGAWAKKNNECYLKITFPEVSEAEKIEYLLQEKGYEPEIKVSRVPEQIEEGYVLNMILPAKNGEKIKEKLLKNKIDSELILLSGGNSMLIIDNILKNKKTAEEKLSSIKAILEQKSDSELLKIEPCSRYAGEKDVFQVILFFEDKNEAERVEKLMKGKNCNFELVEW